VWGHEALARPLWRIETGVHESLNPLEKFMFIVPVSRRAHAQVRGFDRLFDEAVDRLFTQPSTDATPVRRPAVDVSESDRGYVVTLDVPGVTREDVKVSIDGRRVGIVAEARAAATPAEPVAEGADIAEPAKSTERLIVRERAAASFARSFTLQSEIDQASSQAKLENGVLTLTLTKRSANAAQLTVN
jgi:HSP20 family protein